MYTYVYNIIVVVLNHVKYFVKTPIDIVIQCVFFIATVVFIIGGVHLFLLFIKWVFVCIEINGDTLYSAAFNPVHFTCSFLTLEPYNNNQHLLQGLPHMLTFILSVSFMKTLFL